MDTERLWSEPRPTWRIDNDYAALLDCLVDHGGGPCFCEFRPKDIVYWHAAYMGDCPLFAAKEGAD